MADRDRIIDGFRYPTRSGLMGMAGVLLAADQILRRAPHGVWYAGPLDETAHFLTGALVLASLRGLVTRAFAVGLLASSVLIDVDHIPGLLGYDWITQSTPRPYPHSLLTIVLVTLAALVWRSRRSLLLGVLVGLACHFFRDMSESMASGLALFWPLSDHSYATSHWPYLVVMAACVAVGRWRAGSGEALSLPAAAAADS